MIAVTGGRGFVGSSLVRAFSRSEQVVSVIRGESLSKQGRTLEIGIDHPDLEDYLQETTVLIHAAGKVRGIPTELEQANVESVRQITERLPDRLTHVIHFSSLNVYFAEYNLYGETKQRGEAVWKNSPFASRVTVLRPSWIYGPGDVHNSLPLLQQLDRLPVFVAPTAPVRPVYLADLVALVSALASTGTGIGQAWPVSGTEVTSLYAVAKLLAAGLGRRTSVVPLPGFAFRLGATAGRLIRQEKLAQRLTGLQIPKLWHEAAVWDYLPGGPTPLAVGLQRTAAWMIDDRR